jgi:hypothetical protein
MNEPFGLYEVNTVNRLWYHTPHYYVEQTELTQPTECLREHDVMGWSFLFQQPTSPCVPTLPHGVSQTLSWSHNLSFEAACIWDGLGKEQIQSPYAWNDGFIQGLFSPVSKGQWLIVIHAGGAQVFIPNAYVRFKSHKKQETTTVTWTTPIMKNS